MTVWGCSDDEPYNRPADDAFGGDQRVFVLGQEAEGLPSASVTLFLKASDGTVFSREAKHVRRGNISTFNLETGLSEGIYRLLYLRYTPTTDTDGQEAGISSGLMSGEAVDDDGRHEFGLGSRISVTDKNITIIDTFNSRMGMVGMGSPDDPFVISSSQHLFKLMMLVNDYDGNSLVTNKVHFAQMCDIDMKSMSRSCDAEYGWLPIGADTNTPFRGVYHGGGHAVTNLIIKRPNSAGVGLFGYLYTGAVDSLTMRSCTVEGQFATGALAGAVISGGGDVRGSGTITNCRVENSSVGGNATSSMIGGILGALDMHATALLADCTAENTSVSGSMAVGGIFGGAGMYSSLVVSGCDNYADVTSLNSGAGGIVGTADTLQVVASRNFATIQGPATATEQSACVGFGGVVGGAGISWITSSSNAGRVSGYEGVGGIIGSTRIRGSQSEAFLYNQSVLRYCTNSGEVSGKRFVGGAIGEAQAGGYSVCNTGSVSADDYAGGICGASSIAVIHNAVNGGRINADSHVAGIIGKCTWGSLAVCQNVGEIVATSGWGAGIAGLVGNNTVINYCANFGAINGGNGWTGGIVADVGEPREWTGWDIAECVVGSLECVAAFAGPCLAVVEGAVEGVHAAAIAIKIVDISMEVALQATDYVLVGYGMYELICPEVEEAVRQSLVDKSGTGNDLNTATMTDLRNKCKAGDSPLYKNNDLGSRLMTNVSTLIDWYNTDGNDEIFNDLINEKREERAEELEKIAQTKEIIHTVIAGVAVITSTVALVAGEIATGGAATAILAVGACAGLVGGMNAVIKSCTMFEKNAVIISQCVNGARVCADNTSKAGSVAGRMCDGTIMYDCLNAVGDSNKEEFAAEYNHQCKALNCISLVEHSHSGPDGPLEKCVYADAHAGDTPTVYGGGVYAVSVNAMKNAETFSKLGYSIGNDGRWILLSGQAFPVPNRSEMQK